MKIAFIGLGIMGMPMATNISVKHDLIGYDIFKKETPFKFASGYRECGEFADVIVSMVPNNKNFTDLVESLYPYLREGQIWIDMSTISPETNLSMVDKLEKKGVVLCDAPVVKSQPAAVKGELGIYFGGRRDVFDIVLPILNCMGKNIIYMGPNSCGLQMKILHNALVGEIQNGVNEILGMASKSGLDLNDVVTALGYGGAQAFYLDTKSKNIINRDYPTAFSVENMNKDIHFAVQMADSLDADVPSLRNVCKVYEKAMEEGYQKKDFSSSYEIVNKEKL